MGKCLLKRNRPYDFGKKIITGNLCHKEHRGGEFEGRGYAKRARILNSLGCSVGTECIVSAGGEGVVECDSQRKSLPGHGPLMSQQVLSNAVALSLQCGPHPRPGLLKARLLGSTRRVSNSVGQGGIQSLSLTNVGDTDAACDRSPATWCLWPVEVALLLPREKSGLFLCMYLNLLLLLLLLLLLVNTCIGTAHGLQRTRFLGCKL